MVEGNEEPSGSEISSNIWILFSKAKPTLWRQQILISTVVRPFSYAFEMLTCHLAGTGGLGLASRMNIRMRD